MLLYITVDESQMQQLCLFHNHSWDQYVVRVSFHLLQLHIFSAFWQPRGQWKSLVEGIFNVLKIHVKFNLWSFQTILNKPLVFWQHWAPLHDNANKIYHIYALTRRNYFFQKNGNNFEKREPQRKCRIHPGYIGCSRQQTQNEDEARNKDMVRCCRFFCHVGLFQNLFDQSGKEDSCGLCAFFAQLMVTHKREKF